MHKNTYVCVSFFKVKDILSSPDKEENTHTHKRNSKIKINTYKKIKRFNGYSIEMNLEIWSKLIIF